MAEFINDLTKTDDSNDVKQITYRQQLSIIVSLLQRKKLVFAIVAVVVIAILSMTIGITLKNQTKNSQTNMLQQKGNDVLLNELTRLNQQLEELSIAVSKKNDELVSEKIAKDLNSLQNVLSHFATESDIERISKEVGNIKEAINSQLDELKKQFSEKMSQKEYLEESAVPFKVLSIDLIGGQPFVAVDFDHHIIPLGISDALAGWRLSAVDYDSSLAQFVNEKNQYVKINLIG